MFPTDATITAVIFVQMMRGIMKDIGDKNTRVFLNYSLRRQNWRSTVYRPKVRIGKYDTHGKESSSQHGLRKCVSDDAKVLPNKSEKE
jgi:hypothetical protein